jgi:mRNA export factor
MATFGTVTTTQQHNPNKSFEVVSPPTDGISNLSFSSEANYLVASSWDNQVCCWRFNPMAAVPKAAILHDQPVLCTA